MAALVPVSLASSTAQITVTGATATGTLVFNATVNSTFGGFSESWIVDIANVDADAADNAYYGFTAATATVAAGFPFGTYSDTTLAHTVRLVVPAHTKIYVNCADGETRDIRVSASPVLGT